MPKNRNGKVWIRLNFPQVIHNITTISSNSYKFKELITIPEIRSGCTFVVDMFFGPCKNLFQAAMLYQIRSALTIQSVERRLLPIKQRLDLLVIIDNDLSSDINLYSQNSFIGFIQISVITINDYETDMINYCQNNNNKNNIIKLNNKYVLAKIFNLCIRNEYRKLGLGTQLLDCVCKKAKLWGFKNVILEVETDNISAIKLYRKYGFIEIFKTNFQAYDISGYFLNRIEKKSILMSKDI